MHGGDVDALRGTLLQLQGEHVFVVVALQALIGKINAELLEAVRVEGLEAGAARACLPLHRPCPPPPTRQGGRLPDGVASDEAICAS